MTQQTPPRDATASREQRIGRGVAEVARWTLRVLVILLGVAVAAYLIGQAWSIVLPIVLALLLCTALHPISSLIQRVGLPRGIGAAGAVITAIAVAAGLIAVVAPSIAPQFVELGQSGSRSLDDFRDYLQTGPLGLTDANVAEAVAQAQQRLQDSAQSIASGLTAALTLLTNALVNLILTLVLAFMFLKDGHRFLPWLRRVSGPTAGPHLSELLHRVWSTISGFVRAQALVGLIDAVLIGLGLLLLGVPLAGPLALLTFVAAFAPIVGAVTIGALAVLVALVSEGLVVAGLVLVLVLIVQQLEGNVLLPWLQGRSLDIHAAVVLLSIVLGSTLFGVTGAFLSVPVAATLAVVLRYVDEQISPGRSGNPRDPAADPVAAAPDGPDETRVRS